VTGGHVPAEDASSACSAPASTLPLLMALRVKGRASAEAIAAATLRDVDDARRAMTALVADGCATAGGDAFALTPAGVGELRRLLAMEAIDRTALATAYDDAFLACDENLKHAITALQLAEMRGPAPGASGTATTAAAAGHVRAAGRVACGVAARVAAVLPRLGAYERRLDQALAHVAAGDARFVAGTAVDSLHRVWFELHEDLLLTLGRERSA